MALKWMPNNSVTAILFVEDVLVTENGQLIVNCSQHYIPNINMIDVYVNGVFQQKGVFIEESSTTIKFPAGYLRENDVVSIRFKIAGNVNFGNIRVVANYTHLMSIPHPIYNEAALVMDNKTLYRYGDNGWEELLIPLKTQNVGALLSYEKQQITDVTQRTIVLQDLVYPMDTNNMLVFIDGKKVDPSDYTEVDNKTITFLNDLPTGSQEIEFIVANSDDWEELHDHNIEIAYDGTYGNATDVTVKQGTNTFKHTQYIYDATGDNVIQEVITKGPKTIIKNYEYDLNGNVININVNIIN